MGFRPCTQAEDPFTRRVREVYDANVVAAPRSGIDPLDTLAVRGRRVEPRGRLKGLLDGDPPRLPAVRAVPVADLAGVRSASVDVDLGLSLSGKFLASLGVPIPGAALDAQLWKGASGFTFEVRDVIQQQVDVGQLGNALAGRRIARTPATEIFFQEPPTELLIITAALTTSSFVVRARRSSGESVKVSFEGLADLIGSADVGVHWAAEQGDAVSFRGQTPVTFAFSAVPCALDPAGHMVFGLASKELTLGRGEPPVASQRPVIDALGLVSFDEETPP